MGTRWLRSPLAIATGALMVRLAALAYFSRLPAYRLATVWGSGYEVAQVAANLAAGHGFSSPFQVPTGPTAIVPPGYPALLSLIFRFFGPMTVTAAGVAVGLNIVLSAATCLLTLHIANNTIGEREGAVAAWLWALYPPVVASSCFHIWDTTLTVFFATLGYLLGSRLNQASYKAWIVFGAAWGVGALVNPSILAIYGVLLAWVCWGQVLDRAPWRKKSAVAIAAMMLIVAPWIARDYYIFHRLMPVRSNFGLQLWYGNHEGADGFFRVILYPLANPAELQQYRQRGEVGYIAWKQAEAVAFIRAHPREFLRLTRFRISCLWGGIYDGGYAWVFLLTTLPGLWGLALLSRHNRRVMWFFALPLLIYPVPYYVTQPDLRFRLPIEPLLVCLTAYAAVSAWQRWRTRQDAAENNLELSSISAR